MALITEAGFDDDDRNDKDGLSKYGSSLLDCTQCYSHTVLVAVL